MKACAIAVVSAVLFAAEVHAEDFLRTERFEDSACSVLKEESYEELTCQPGTWHLNGEDFDVYWQYACTSGTTATKRFYGDSGCTTAHPNVTIEQNLPLGGCAGSGSNQYIKWTCPVTKTVTEENSFIYRTYASDDAACAGDPESSGRRWLDECQARSQLSGGTWVDSSRKYVRSGGFVNELTYTDTACGNGETSESWRCGTWECESLGVAGYRSLECAWHTSTTATTSTTASSTTTATTAATTTTATTTTTAPPTTTTAAVVADGAAAQAPITAAHAAALAGLLARALL